MRRIDIAIGITNGVRFMHSRNPIIIHQDLKPSNVIVSAAMQCIILVIGAHGCTCIMFITIQVSAGLTRVYICICYNTPASATALGLGACKSDIARAGVL